MTTNLIKQIIKGNGDGLQTIKMVVRSNERGPQGEPGEPGKDGVIQYTAGEGINISSDNVISATGGGGSDINVVQTTGTSTTDVMSQNAATQFFYKTAGNAITMTGNKINALIYPSGFFTVPDKSTVKGIWSDPILSNSIKNYSFKVGEANANLETHFADFRIYGDLSQNGTPSVSNPVDINVVAGEQRVEIHGKNIFGIRNIQQSENGITFSRDVIADGGFRLSGTATADAEFRFEQEYDAWQVVGGAPYTLSLDGYGGIPAGVSFSVGIKEGTSITPILTYTSEGTQIAGVGTGTRLVFSIKVARGTSINRDFWVQLERGETATEFVPFQYHQDYVINLGSLELCKIGDYQDFIYWDSYNNTYILQQQIGKIDSYDGETITTQYVSTTGELSTGATVYYVLSVPNIVYIDDNEELIETFDNFRKNAYSYSARAGLANSATTSFVVTSAVQNNLPMILEVSAYKKSLDGLTELIEDNYESLDEKIEYVKRNADFKTLTNIDADFSSVGGDDYIALWNLDTGRYILSDSASVKIAVDIESTPQGDEAGYRFSPGERPILIVDKGQEYNNLVNAVVLTNTGIYRIAVYTNGTLLDFKNYPLDDFEGTDGINDGNNGLVPAPTTADVDKFLKSDGTWATAGGGGIRTLTTADYNYPVNNPTYINLGLFDPGIYFVDDNARIYDGHNANNYRSSYTFVVTGGDGDSTVRNIMVIYPAATASSGEYKISFFYTFTSNPYPWSARGSVLASDYITNNLTTNNANRVLSAAQGVALKSLIDGLVISGAGAPTTSTTGVVGQLYEDTTNGKLYQCTAVSGSTYTWSEVGGGGGGGDTVYSDKSTSNNATGGAVYIGNLDANQDEQPDPTTTDSHYHYFWALPYLNTEIPQQSSINILGQNEGGATVSLGINAITRLDNQVAVGAQTLNNYSAVNGVALGYGAQCQAASSVALGARARATRAGEINIGNSSSEGFNNTEYRVLGGVHDGQLAQDAVTVNQVNATIDAINSALSTNIPHIGASS